MSKYDFSPNDIAKLLCISEFTHSEEKFVIEDIFINHKDDITASYRNDINKFRREIHNKIIIHESDYDTFSETEMILREFGLSISDDNFDDIFGSYFKLIKLQILYSQSHCKTLKLRSILKKFGYKRRSNKLNYSILNILKSLGLVTYLRGKEPCDITEINIDQMVIFRLK